MFADVQEQGPAHAIGIEPGDLLLGMNRQELDTTKPPVFPVGEAVTVSIRKRDGRDVQATIVVPKPKSGLQPFSLPQAVVYSKLERGIGYLKVNMFPGLIGIEVSRDIDRAIDSFQECQGLVIDLRGNSGGGLGALRLMSYLTPDHLPVGYSVTRKRAKNGYEKERLVRFGHIPAHKWQLPLLALRYGFIDHSIALVTEGLGAQPFHGRIAILVNQHSASAAEMVAAFAQENGLATIVGTKTPGRLVGSRPFKLPYGYFLVLPVGAYLTWGGRRLEGSGVQPEVAIDVSREALIRGQDNQRERAAQTLGWSEEPHCFRGDHRGCFEAGRSDPN
jgi:C-terminal processing protease CtpA/Prc